MLLVIGNKNYSSWSLRPWIALKVLGIPFDELRIPLYRPGSKEQILGYSPTGKVPILRDGDTVYRTWHTNGRGTEQLSHSFALIDLLPYGRQEEWQDSPEDWPQSPTYSRWASSEDIAALYGPDV